MGYNRIEDVMSPRLNEYDDSEPDSIYSHSKKLIGNSIRDLYPVLIKKGEDGNGLNQMNKGLLGNLVELYHFGKIPDRSQSPDFPNAGENGCELKCTGLDNNQMPKELLRITRINIKEVTKFETFINKLRLVVLILYKYADDTKWQDMNFVKSILIDLESDVPELIIKEIEEEFYRIIKLMKDGDFTDIRKKTDYIVAGTQGKKGGDPFQRAIYLHKSFISLLLNKEQFKIITDDKDYIGKTLHEVLIEKINPYLGKNLEELKVELDISYSKGKNALLVKKMLGLDEKEESIEMKASNIEIKTIDLGSNNKEHMSFPHINFVEMSKEKDFYNSEFYNQVSPTFLFVIIDKDDKDNQFLKNTKTYRLKDNELLEVKKVWKHTLNKIKKGIYDEFMLYETSRPRLLNRDRNAIAHIRPHDSKNPKTGKYKPVMTPQGLNKSLKRHCLWFNRDFIDSIIN